MQKLSILIFSRNDIAKALDLIKNVYDVADEICIFDSSDKNGHNLLLNRKKWEKLDKLKVFKLVALGYPDPMRMYALKKCKYEWALLLDTDELLSNELKLNLKSIISNTRANAFAIKRYEEVSVSGERTTFFTWQIRLFKKSKVLFKGLLHEQPQVCGELGRLDQEEFCINHINEKRAMTSHEYSTIERFHRFSYFAFNKQMLDYASKISMSKNRDIRNTHKGNAIISILLAYEKITFKRPEDELANFDYFMLYFLRDAAYAIKSGNMLGILSAIKSARMHVKQINKWQNEKDGNTDFEISKIIQEKGITRYLDLDKEKIINSLNKKYLKKEQGVNLLIHLLKEKYKKRSR